MGGVVLPCWRKGKGGGKLSSLHDGSGGFPAVRREKKSAYSNNRGKKETPRHRCFTIIWKGKRKGECIPHLSEKGKTSQGDSPQRGTGLHRERLLF